MATKPLNTERRPRKPFKGDRFQWERSYQPSPAWYRYKVKDGDSWVTLAKDGGMDPWELIYVNFYTVDPNEVNWYLREYVGCNVPTKDGLNWTFSSSANPGKIWRPVKTFDVEPMNVTGTSAVSPIAFEFNGPGAPLDTLGKVFDVYSVVSLGIQVSEVELPALLDGGLTVIDTAATLASLYLSVGGPTEGALNAWRRGMLLDGLARGIVLAADQRSVRFIRRIGLGRPDLSDNVLYREYGKQFEGYYVRGLAIGIVNGRQFNTVGRYNLFAWIGAHMSAWARKEYVGGESSRWSDRKWASYYILCGDLLKKKIVLR
jgi:hypothetical protein